MLHHCMEWCIDGTCGANLVVKKTDLWKSLHCWPLHLECWYLYNYLILFMYFYVIYFQLFLSWSISFCINLYLTYCSTENTHAFRIEDLLNINLHQSFFFFLILKSHSGLKSNEAVGYPDFQQCSLISLIRIHTVGTLMTILILFSVVPTHKKIH